MIADIIGSVNIVTVSILCVFMIPIVVGIIRPLTSGRIRRSLLSLLNSLILLSAVILSVYLTRVILSGNDNFVLTMLYQAFLALEYAVESKAIWVYILLIITLLLVIDGILYLLTLPVRRYAISPAANKISTAASSMNGFVRRIVGGLWQLPKSLWLVLVFSILLNFYTGFFNSSLVVKAANTSALYQLVQGKLIQPLLNTSVVKDIEVILNDSFEAAKSENAGGGGYLSAVSIY